MSGGVDSSIAAALLKKDGHEVHGFFMTLAQEDLDEQVARARKIAGHLDIPLTVTDLSRAFAETVLDYFCESYAQGRTPNPCVLCNHSIKFGRLLEAATDHGCKLLATGHYARVARNPDGSFSLLRGLDSKKDQSYFLCRLTQRQLARIVLPHGEHTKEDVYEMAAELGLSGKHSVESQDVCFLKNQDVGGFLESRLSMIPSPGPIITADNKQIGTHAGIHHFTIGQRRGLGIPAASPYYVTAIRPETDTVVAGKKDDLWQDTIIIKNINWLSGISPRLPQQYMVKIRYRHQPAAATAEPGDEERLVLHFQEPQLAVTPGQFAVFYQEDEVIGSGEICYNKYT